MQKNEEHILRRVEQTLRFQKHREALDLMQEDLDKKKNNGIVEEKYLKFKKQLKT